MKPGSILVFLLLLMFLIMAASLGVWRSVALMHDVAVQRARYVQRTSELEGLLQLGIAWCSDNRKHLCAREDGSRCMLAVDAWPLENLAQRGEIAVVFQPPELLITAQLFVRDGASRTASCRVHTEKRSRKKSGKLRIHGYRIA